MAFTLNIIKIAGYRLWRICNNIEHMSVFLRYTGKLGDKIPSEYIYIYLMKYG